MPPNRPRRLTPPAVAPLTSSQLDALVAPIALYPDALVAQVLAAASYADEVAFADLWLAQNQNLQGDRAHPGSGSTILGSQRKSADAVPVSTPQSGQKPFLDIEPGPGL